MGPLVAAVGAIGAAVGAVGSFVASLGFVGQAVIGIGLSVAASYLQQSLAGKPETTQGGVQFERQYGAAVGRQVAVGPFGIAGHDCYVNTYGPANFGLQQVYVLSDYPCNALTRVSANGEWLEIEAEPGSHSQFGRAVTTGPYAGLMWFKFHNGKQATADGSLIVLSNPVGRWTANHIGTGCAYVVVTMAYDKDNNSSFPDFFFEGEGAPLYDWRQDSTVGGSGAHRWDDPSTHEYSANPIVAEYNYRRGFAINGDIFCGMGMPAADLPLDRWTAAANLCDESTDYGARYRVSILLDCTAEHGSNIASLQLACGAMTVDGVDGAWPVVGHDQPIAATFTDDDLISTAPVRWQARRSMSSLVNSVAGKCPDPDQLWSLIDYDTATNGDLVALDRRDRDLALDLPQVPWSAQAAALAAIYLKENRYEATGSVTLPPRFLGIEPGDWVRWNSDLYGDRTYLVSSTTLASLDAEGPRNVQITLEERDGAIYDPTEAGAIVVPVPAGAPDYLAEVQSFTAIAILLTGADGRKAPGIRAAWDAIEDVTVAGVDVEYYPTAQPEAALVRRIAAGQTVAILDGVLSGTAYTVRTRLVTEPGRPVGWSAGTSVTTHAVAVVQNVNDFAAGLREKLLEQTDAALADIRQTQERLAGALADLDAQSWQDRQDWLFQMRAGTQRVTASYSEAITVATGPDSAIAAALTELEAQVDDFEANLSIRWVTTASLPDGALAAYEVVAKVDDGLATSSAAMTILAYSDGVGGAKSVVHFDAERFVVTNSASGETISPFVIDDTSVAISGTLIKDGTVTAEKILVGELGAITGNLGSIYTAYIELGTPLTGNGIIISGLPGEDAFIDFFAAP